MSKAMDINNRYKLETPAGYAIINASGWDAAVNKALQIIKSKNAQASSKYGYAYGHLLSVSEAGSHTAKKVSIATMEYDPSQRMSFVQYMDGTKEWIYA